MKQIWYVRGEDAEATFPTFFDEKLAAEIYARLLFPDEAESKRYNRIFYREVLTTLDLKGSLK